MGEGQLALLWLMVSTLALLTLIFGIRYLRNKENMSMIEKGMDPKLNEKRPAPYQNLKWGLLLMGAGAGLFFAFILHEYVFENRVHNNPAIYFALIAMGGGAGLINSYRIERRELLKLEN